MVVAGLDATVGRPENRTRAAERTRECCEGVAGVGVDDEDAVVEDDRVDDDGVTADDDTAQDDEDEEDEAGTDDGQEDEAVVGTGICDRSRRTLVAACLAHSTAL